MMPALLDRVRGGRWVGPALFAAVVAGYLALSQFVLWLNNPVNLGAGFWPAAGFSLAILVLTRPKRWGWIVAGIGCAELGGDLALGFPLQASLWWTAGNCLEPLVGALLLRRWRNPTGALVPVRQLLTFFAAGVLVGPLVGATIGMIGTAGIVGIEHWWQIWPRYVVGDALGVLVIAPMLLCWRSRAIPRHPAERVALFVTLVVATVEAFHLGNAPWDQAVPYVVIPLLTWAALRHGCRGAAVAVFTVTQIANWSTATGDGPFAEAAADGGQAITLLQVFLGIVAMTTFLLAALVEDLVDRTEVERRLEDLAATDTLTGLPNRARLMSALAERLAGPSSAAGVGVCICDVDHFKVVNDGLGHHAGDELLVEIAQRLRHCVRAGDLVARFGGDEFVVLIEGPAERVEDVAQRLIDRTGDPVTLEDGTRLTPSLSIGVGHARPGGDPASLLRDADTALFRAKELGRGRYHRFDGELAERVVERLFVRTELPEALADRQVTCLYQPEIRIATGEVVCFEVHTRWDHPTNGVIAPDRFLPVVEAMGAADRLFEQVIAEALAAQEVWAELVGFHPPVAVNISGRQLGGTTVATVIAGAAARHGAPVDSIWVEVAESAVSDDSASGALRELHDLGVRIAIDDFGTGWSSMARLATFPWDLLKIERSFVRGLGRTDGYPDRFVRSTIAMAHALGIPTTAEGVETAEQLDRLAELGCDIAQGDLLAPPVAARDAIDHVGSGRIRIVPTRPTVADPTFR